MKPLVVLLLNIFILAPLMVSPVYSFVDRGLYIITTFPSLVHDVRLLTHSSDVVESLIPYGVDPHEYQLKPSDVEKVLRADIVVSTGHTSFEKSLKETLFEHGWRGVFIEIISMDGVVIMENPTTHKPNYHMVVYDPYNYIVFIEKLGSELARLRPWLKQYYLSKTRSVVDRIYYILNNTRRIECIAVADTPLTQYAVSWTGIKVKYLVIKEHGLPASPRDLENIAYGLEKGFIDIVVVTKPIASKYSKTLVDIAHRYGRPILYVESPLVNKSIVEKLEYIMEQLSSIDIRYSLNMGDNSLYRDIAVLATGVLLIATISSLVYSIYIGTRRRW